MEQKLGRILDPGNETIDHIDGDFTNNSFDNLRIIPRGQHARDDAEQALVFDFKCKLCQKKDHSVQGVALENMGATCD